VIPENAQRSTLNTQRSTLNVQRPTLNAQRPTPNAQRPIEENSGFDDALDDDLNISGALGFLFETIRETNRVMDESKLDPKTAAGWLSWWNRINKVLDFERDETELPEEVAKLAEARAQARLAKDFRKSDELRDKLNALGWEARDTKDGQKITRRAGA